MHPFLVGARKGVAKHVQSVAFLGAAAYEDQVAEPVDYLWNGYLEASHLATIAGPSGVGKSTLAFLLAAALANPTHQRVRLLGREVTPIPDGKCVCILEEENGRRSTATNLRWSCEMLRLPIEATLDRIVTFVRTGARIRMQADREESVFACLWERAEAGRVGALIIDSWATVCAPPGADSRSEEHQSTISKWLRSFVDVSGGPVVVIAHTRKSSSETLEDVSGSAQRGAAMDVVLLVSAEKSEGIVQSSRVSIAKLRDTPDDPPPPATFTITREGGTHVLVDGEAPETSDPAHERVFAYLENQTGAVTNHEIKQALRMNTTTVQSALTTLFGERRIRRSTKTVRGREFPAYETSEALDRELRERGFDPAGGGLK